MLNWIRAKIVIKINWSMDTPWHEYMELPRFGSRALAPSTRTVNVCWYYNRFLFAVCSLVVFSPLKMQRFLPSKTDTHKKEGAFCVWEEQEISQLLQEERTTSNTGENIPVSYLFMKHYGVDSEGNVKTYQLKRPYVVWHTLNFPSYTPHPLVIGHLPVNKRIHPVVSPSDINPLPGNLWKFTVDWNFSATNLCDECPLKMKVLILEVM